LDFSKSLFVDQKFAAKSVKKRIMLIYLKKSFFNIKSQLFFLHLLQKPALTNTRHCKIWTFFLLLFFQQYFLYYFLHVNVKKAQRNIAKLRRGTKAQLPNLKKVDTVICTVCHVIRLTEYIKKLARLALQQVPQRAVQQHTTKPTPQGGSVDLPGKNGKIVTTQNPYHHLKVLGPHCSSQLLNL
jgi:hypothetical protein